ncbi:XRE family transcriptional regulator [Marinomonas ushuaiensis DSM 15871]|uniref:XRE family transcriptional regulator n=1 Tax=Marinomonas ushuaiensis DSM 15871 TaxID=1122207 RepID=X7EB28_9GAMM|nr:helix-turn-helix domain-containing protein [Marinomonas ushuaiensis]ETX12381.1 XRE family transcriptional regulator [Marinomonas ushuaiensis DSM 15871]
MKMKDQLDSAQPMKKHKAKSKKADLKKKKKAKLDIKKQSKEQKQKKIAPLPTPVEKQNKEPETRTPEIEPPVVSTAVVSNTTPEAASKTINVQTIRSRASKSLAPMTKTQQRTAINKIIKSLILKEITQGIALRELRVNVLGLRQEAYTELTGVSRKTLSEIENDKGNYTPETINKVFKPFELKMALIPISSSTLKTLLH